MANQLYEFTIKVTRGDGCDLPKNMAGAYVPCYVGAPNFQVAVQRGVAAITGLHYLFQDIQGQVREIPFASWTEYIAKVWPDFPDHFPSQGELPSLVERGTVFFGPFAGF